MGYATLDAAPVYVGSTDNKLKFIPSGPGGSEIEILTEISTGIIGVFNVKSYGAVGDGASY